jgi:predicted CXXCH cytochrome family protein
MLELKQTWPLILLCFRLAPAQEIDTAIGGNKHAKSLTLFDDIRDARENSSFRELWETREPGEQRKRTVDFIERYPRSVLLKEAYEIVARACVALGDYTAGLDWAKRSLRLMPENPFLLAMVADVAAGHGQLDLADASARDALRYLEYSDKPSSLSEPDWPRIRNDLRETSYYALGRAAAARGRNKEAEESLLTALSLNPGDMDALYVLGVARAAAHQDSAAAPCFVGVMRTNGPLSAAAGRFLRQIYDRGPHSPAIGFDEYAASLQWVAPQPAPTEPRKPAQDRYAGSNSCRECHASEYQNWQATGMAKMFRPYSAVDAIGDFSGRQVVSGSARAVSDGDKRFIEIRDAETDRWIRYPVDYMIGSKWQQAYATKLSSGELLVFPIQYNRLESAWVNYWKIVDGPGSQRADISRFHEISEGAVYQNDCAACHTSQLRFQKGSDAPESATYREGGINCEMCHGPSLLHVESKHEKKIVEREAVEPPVDFKRISAEDYVEICAQCHMQSAVHEAQPRGAVNYSEDSGPFYRAYRIHLLTDFSRRAFYSDGRFRATTFIVEAFKRSRCFRSGGATCGSCHNPHPSDAATNSTSFKFRKDSDEMCLQCHENLRDRPERHTHHVGGTEASQCVSCHMPRIMDAVLFRARYHQIDDIPDAGMTERFGESESPNACLACHRDRDTGWLRRQMAALWMKQ